MVLFLVQNMPNRCQAGNIKDSKTEIKFKKILENGRGRELCFLHFSKPIYYGSNNTAYVQFGSQLSVSRHS